MRTAIACCVLALSAPLPAAPPAPEVVQTEHWGTVIQATKSLLLEGKYEELTETAKRYREGEKSADGNWKLEYFYAGFGDGKDATEWEKIFAALEEWAEREKEDPAPIIAQGEANWSFGKQARGSGFADSVTPEGWKILRERMQKGRELLKSEEERCRTCPGYFAVMLKIGIDGSADRRTFMKWFDDGVKLAPDFLTLYEMKSYYILPRWYGREGELAKFVADLAKDQPMAAVWVLWRLQHQGVYNNVFNDVPLSWPKLREPLLGAFGDDDVAPGNMVAYLADVAGDDEAKLAALARVGNRLDPQRWRHRDRMDAAKAEIEAAAEE